MIPVSRQAEQVEGNIEPTASLAFDRWEQREHRP